MRATPKHQDNLAGKVIVLRRKSTHPPGRRLCWLSEDYHSCNLIISPPATLSRLTKPSASSFDVPTLAYLQRNPHTPLLSYRFVFHPTARGVGEIKAARPCVDSVGGLRIIHRIIAAFLSPNAPHTGITYGVNWLQPSTALCPRNTIPDHVVNGRGLRVDCWSIVP